MSIVANYIKGQTKNAQFIIISLRNNMFEVHAPARPASQRPDAARLSRRRAPQLADRLIGIYKPQKGVQANCTKCVAINPAAFTMPAVTSQ